MPIENTPRFGLFTLTCIVVASMIGSGVFTTSGFSLAALGSPALVLAAWATGGAIAFCGAIAYGQLARLLPISGGEYLYLSRRLHPCAGFLAGWVSLTAGFSGAIAMAAITFETYAFNDGRPQWLPPNATAALLIVVFGLGHAFLVRTAAVLQNTIVTIKLAVLVAFLVIAALHFNQHPWSWTPLSQNPDAATPLASVQIQTFAESVMWISLSYAGFNSAIYVASEVRNPELNVPRSLWIGTTLVTILYLLLNAVFVTAVPASEIAGQERVAAIAANAVGGNPLQNLVRLAVCLGTLSSVAGMIMTGPRVFSRMADDGLFPSWFRSGPFSTSRTVLLQTAIALMLLSLTDLMGLLNYLSALLALSSALTVATLLLPNTDKSKVAQHQTISPLITITACFYVTATIVTGLLLASRDVRNLTGTAITLLIGVVLWFLTARKSSLQQPP